MKWIRTTILFSISVSAAFGDVITGTAVFTGVNGNSVGGYYTSPYYLTFNNQPVNGYCDDFIDHVTVGETWQANEFSGADLSKTYWGLTDPNYVKDYTAMFWLVQESALGLVDPVLAQQALWSVEDPAYVPPAAATTLVQQAMNSTVDLANFTVLDSTNPSDPNRPQEFIVDTPGQSGTQGIGTPEPSTVLLFGAGLLLIVIGKRKAVTAR